MKTMTCKQLGGPCDEEFHAETFEEMAELNQQHGMEMAAKGDRAHIAVMERMRDQAMDPATMQAWVDKVRQEFDYLPED